MELKLENTVVWPIKERKETKSGLPEISRSCSWTIKSVLTVLNDIGNRMNWCKMVICFSRHLPGRFCGSTYGLRLTKGTKSWMESGMPDNCHQKSFPITCQAFRALRLTDSYYPYRIKTWHACHVYQRWFNWDDSSRNPHCVCFCSTGWGPWKAKVKIPRAPAYLSCFNICEAQGVPQNGMSDQTHSAKVCLDLCGPEPDLPRLFPGEEKRYVWVQCKAGSTGLQDGPRKEAESLGESR